MSKWVYIKHNSHNMRVIQNNQHSLCQQHQLQQKHKIDVLISNTFFNPLSNHSRCSQGFILIVSFARNCLQILSSSMLLTFCILHQFQISSPCKWMLMNSFRTWCTTNDDDNHGNQIRHIKVRNLRDSMGNGSRNVPRLSLRLSQPSITTKLSSGAQWWQDQQWLQTQGKVFRQDEHIPM